jgi:RNA polymerase sigma-70 factor, ECF subfamily
MVQEEAQIRAAQRGSIEAFNTLVLTYQNQVYTIAFRILQDAAAADDICQDTFVTAFQKLNQFQGGNFRAWLLRIATNACYDELRRRKRRPIESLTQEDGNEEADLRLVSSAESPERYAQRQELHSAIEDCFNNLSDEHRLVVLMCDVQEYSYEEIAHVAQISTGTVKSRISRARSRMKDCLQTKGELLPSEYRLNE